MTDLITEDYDCRVPTDQIPERRFPGNMGSISIDIERIILHFFSSPDSINIPFRGFLLEGPPGNGKTELVKQVARNVALTLDRKNRTPVSFFLVDSANIAAAKWGDAEKRLRSFFREGTTPGEKVILLLDDIDCLMIKRGASVAVEWHYSINSVLFHQLDKINPTKTMFIATTNRTDLIDDALRSRLYFYDIPALSMEDLEDIGWEMVKGIPSIQNKYEFKDSLNLYIRTLKEKIDSREITHKDSPDIRDLQHAITKLYLEGIH